MGLRRADPGVGRSWLYRAHGRLTSTRLLRRLALTRAWGAVVWRIDRLLLRRLALTRAWGAVVWRIDRLLLRLTGDRASMASPVVTALLETRGARTGQVRRNAVIYFHDGERVAIVASKAGRPGNPAWFHNAVRNPEVHLGGEPFRAEIVQDEASRSRLWSAADRVFPAFAAYRDTAGRAGRSIPILRLTPR